VRGDVAQLGEHWLCKPEVAGSIPVISTSNGGRAGPAAEERGFRLRPGARGTWSLERYAMAARRIVGRPRSLKSE
jgi:hypothetical protein